MTRPKRQHEANATEEIKEPEILIPGDVVRVGNRLWLIIERLPDSEQSFYVTKLRHVEYDRWESTTSFHRLELEDAKRVHCLNSVLVKRRDITNFNNGFQNYRERIGAEGDVD